MSVDRFEPFRRFFNSRVVVIVALVLIVLFSLGLTRELLRRNKTEAEIARLEAESKRLEDQRKELAQLLTFMNTETFQESEARVRLNLRKPGETTVIVPTADSSTVDTAEFVSRSTISYPERWWQYLFTESR